MKYLLAVLFFAFCVPADALMLSPQMGLHESASLSGHLFVLRDKAGQLDIKTIAAPEKANEFVALPEFLAAGYTADTYWLRFTLQRTAETSDHWLLEVTPPFLNDVTLFVPNESGSFDVTTLGDLHPYAERPVAYRNFVFPIRLPNDQPITLYLRVKTSSAMLVNIVAWQYMGMLTETQNDSILYSTYFGILLLGLVTNLAFWFWLRERLYLHYCSYLTMLTLVMIATGGAASQWFFPHMPLIANRMLGTTISLVFLLGTHFFIVVLRLREHFPRFSRLLNAVLIFYGLCALMSMAGYYGIVAPWLMKVVLVTNTCVAFTGPWLLWRGYREYWLYILSFTVSFAAIPLTVARLMGWFTLNLSADYTTMLGAIIHIVLLNFAVVDRMRRLDANRHAVEKQAAELFVEHHAVKQQRQFVAMISHEFRTPLAIIDTTAQSVEIACSQQSNEMTPAIIMRQEKIRRAVSRMITLLDNFLTDERLDLNEIQLKLKLVDLRELTSESAELWHHLQHFPGQLQLDLADESVNVIIDPAIMTVALSNLIDNAIKYSPLNGTITLRVHKTHNDGWIEVVDCGIGISPEEIEKIFDKFYRSNDAVVMPGAGLGLYLVRTIVNHNGGDIDVVSELGKGSCFRIRLPLAEQP